MDHYDEKMNYSFEPVAPETPQPPLEQAKEEIRRSGKNRNSPQRRSRRPTPPTGSNGRRCRKRSNPTRATKRSRRRRSIR